MKKLLAATFLFSLVSIANAVPIEIDTPDARIIVVRPIDLWSGDKATQDKSIQAHQQKTTWYTLKLNEKIWLFSNMAGKDPASNPISQTIAIRLDKAGFSTPRSSANSFTIQPASYIEPSEITAVISVQNESFRRTVIANGNPDDLEAQTSRKKFFGGIVALGTLALAADKYGLNAGVSATLGSGISESAYNSIAQYKPSMVPVIMPNIDPKDFKVFELRPVTTAQPERTGQILIGYKTDKTEAVQAEAIIAATLALTGADSTTEEIEKNRAADFSKRKAIWDACVADAKPECKAE
jgi:hypothetical protein